MAQRQGDGRGVALRVSDREREVAVAALREHAIAGRLTSEELAERIGEAYAARTAGDLGHALRELPRSVANSRPRALDRTVARFVRKGWRVESQSTYTAVIVRGRRPNHAVHGLLTLLTGVWAFVWIAVALTSGERRALLEVEDDGRVAFERIRR